MNFTMLRGLVAKELRQHGMAFLFLALLLGAALLVISGNRVLRVAAGSGFEGVRLLLTLFSPLACIVLCHALIAAEFRQKTQLFLEALPLPRWRMIAVKYALGLATLLLGVAVALAVAGMRGRGMEAMTPRFAAILALKSAAWAWVLFSLFFAHAFLGRYRVLIGVALLFVFLYAQQAGLDTGQFWPFRLVDTRFAYERAIMPVEALAWTALLAATLTGAAFLLGLVRDATVASLLAERMSPRERVMVVFVSFAALMSFGYVLERQQNAAPVRMPGAVEVASGPARVAASAAVDAPLPEESAAAGRVAAHVAEELALVAEYLGCASLPPVFIVHRRDLKADEFQNGGLKPAQGLLVRANLTAPGFSDEPLLRWLTRETLLLKSRGRANLEPNAWVLDGFPLWWAHHRGKQPPPAARPAEIASALGAMPPDFSRRTLERWLSLRQRAGEPAARALAWTGLATLAERHGAEACRRFLAAMLARDVPLDARGWLGDALRPMPRRFRAATGVSLDAFSAEWKQALEATSTPP